MSSTIEEMTGLKGSYLDRWDNFVGQTAVKRMLQITCTSAKMRGERLEHVFLAGEGGYGKTTLAILMALTMGRRIVFVSGSIDVNQFRILVSDMEDKDVLLWDEFHLSVVGGKNKVEFMLNVLQDQLVKGPNGVAEEIPDITVIACTTDPGRLPTTILDRFRYVELTGYTDEEAEQVAEGWADRILGDKLPFPSGANYAEIAHAASNNPRRMLRIMEMLRDIAIATELSNWSAENDYDISEALSMLGLTHDGLTQTAQRYLTVLLRMGGSAGSSSIAEALNEKGGLGHVEKLLMDRDLIYRGPRGRVLTQAGIHRAKELR